MAQVCALPWMSIKLIRAVTCLACSEPGKVFNLVLHVLCKNARSARMREKKFPNPRGHAVLAGPSKMWHYETMSRLKRVKSCSHVTDVRGGVCGRHHQVHELLSKPTLARFPLAQ
ncbi:hypothetical protein BU23DRAFT_159035 [Bimuria novae-zelandiae CBS 107.79]|uniref:Secreted protein n=1 Tax=Bimuria novae-zelandiae CBS 107.79 TaxID=1447943 RepID=A0A6A5V5V4_9PLEO|nr:hypothetical protein BU23DRAFT_159035 [Bimuria novae-zelandiae CBS 107.79]